MHGVPPGGRGMTAEVREDGSRVSLCSFPKENKTTMSPSMPSPHSCHGECRHVCPLTIFPALYPVSFPTPPSSSLPVIFVCRVFTRQQPGDHLLAYVNNRSSKREVFFSSTMTVPACLLAWLTCHFCWLEAACASENG